jgi:hypothetical protein
MKIVCQVIMATNRIDILDPALLRPGRIDRKIEFPPPNEEARLDILKIHSRKMNLTRGINLRKIAELMPGASGAEVKVCDNGCFIFHTEVFLIEWESWVAGKSLPGVFKWEMFLFVYLLLFVLNFLNIYFLAKPY